MKSYLKSKPLFRCGIFTLLVILVIGFIIPEQRIIPVKDATPNDWNKDSFWYEPWGTSGVHKGIDIFAPKGTPLQATTNMLLLYKGKISKGGNIVIGLGPRWRFHYYAHLDNIDSNVGVWAARGESIGTVGDTGNAQGKPAHLHYSIVSLVPLLWKMDTTTQGYKKAFYLDPISYLSER